MRTAVKPYVAGMALLAALSLAISGWRVPEGDLSAFWNALVALLLLGFLSEASYLRLRVGSAETQSSIAFIPFVASVILVDTGWAATAAAFAVLGVEYGVKKKSSIKVIFNVSQMTLSVAASSAVYQVLGGNVSLVSFSLSFPALAGAVLTYFLINSTAVSVAVALGDGIPLREAWRRIAGSSLLYDVFSSPLGPLLAFLYVQWQLAGILLLVLPLAFVRRIYQVNLQLEQVNRDLLELMVKAIEARDAYTSGHSLRVSKIAEQIGREYGLGAKALDQVRTAALLHDVGKIHEDFAPLLRKNAKLDGTERALMQTHPARSAELVGTISAFRGPIAEAVRHHHENYDGTGYPAGLSGSAIPLAARIIMVADTVDAMTTNRPYRLALSFEAVVGELERLSGLQFDSDLVRVVLRSSAIRAMVASRVASQTAASPGLEVLASSGRRPGALPVAVSR